MKMIAMLPRTYIFHKGSSESVRPVIPGVTGLCRIRAETRRPGVTLSSSGLNQKPCKRFARAYSETRLVSRIVIASAASPSPGMHASERNNGEEETRGLVKMARLNNLLPSMFMVMIGAWAGAGKSGAISVLAHPTVLTVALVSGCITSASMIINDYFDWASGVDAVNRPDKPLITGQVNPTAALLASLYIYTGVLVAACLMDSLHLRTIIALSAGLTILYTPFLKRISVLKNLVVAAVISLSPLAGALAAGAAGASLTGVITSCIFAFLGVVYREIVMDITDEEGDRLAGMKTLPVVLGKQGAMVAACYSLVCAALVGLTATIRCGGLTHWAASLAGPAVLQAAPALPAAICSLTLIVILAPVFSSAARVFASGMDQGAVDDAVEVAMPRFALGMLLLSAVA